MQLRELSVVDHAPELWLAERVLATKGCGPAKLRPSAGRVVGQPAGLKKIMTIHFLAKKRCQYLQLH
jgi:hypothetical protein